MLSSNRESSSRRIQSRYSDSKTFSNRDNKNLLESDIKETKNDISEQEFEQKNKIRKSSIPPKFKNKDEEIDFLRKKYTEKKNLIDRLVIKVEQYRSVSTCNSKGKKRTTKKNNK